MPNKQLTNIKEACISQFWSHDPEAIFCRKRGEGDGGDKVTCMPFFIHLIYFVIHI